MLVVFVMKILYGRRSVEIIIDLLEAVEMFKWNSAKHRFLHGFYANGKFRTQILAFR